MFTSKLATGPSDRLGASNMSTVDTYWRAKGNYNLHWGNVMQPHTGAVPIGIAPFGYQNRATRTQIREPKFNEFLDGTSNTLLLSEQLVPRTTATRIIAATSRTTTRSAPIL